MCIQNDQKHYKTEIVVLLLLITYPLAIVKEKNKLRLKISLSLAIEKSVVTNVIPLLETFVL